MTARDENTAGYASPPCFMHELDPAYAPASIAQLQRLDDRLLADIGIFRGQIPQIVDGLCRTPEKRGENFQMAA